MMNHARLFLPCLLVICLLHVFVNQESLSSFLPLLDPVAVVWASIEENSTILTKEHYRRVGESIARVFPAWKHEESWCVSERLSMRDLKDADSVTGIIYVKNPKAASSTIEGIVKRIAIRHGLPDQPCASYTGHIVGPGPFYGHRLKEKSFLIGSVRDPTSRAVSRVWFDFISRRFREPTDDFIVGHALNSKNRQLGTISSGQGGFQTVYLSLHDIPANSAWKESNATVVVDPHVVHENVKKIMQDYDFMIVTERMDESLVAMQLILGLDTGSILSTSSKAAGQYILSDGRCIPHQKKFTSPAVKAFLESDEWQAKNYGDFVLHAAAHKSLDLTINQLGRSKFTAALDEYKRLKSVMDEVCAPRAIFPCSDNGTAQIELSSQNCYMDDEGCGYPCIDEMLSDETRSEGQ